MKTLFLFLSLSGFYLAALAQEVNETPTVPRWRAGVDISQPVLLQFDNFAGWDKAMQVEGLVQRRLGKKGVWWPQLYAGYFAGKNQLSGGTDFRQRGFYIKPGMSFHFDRNGTFNPFLELSILSSWGRLKGDVTVQDPIFGDTQQQADQAYSGGGLSAGIGFYPFKVGSFPVRVSSSAFIGGYGGVEEMHYLPGAGVLPGIILYVNLNVRLYLLREW